MASDAEMKSRLRREQDILDRLENVKRLIQMECTLTTTGVPFSRYKNHDKNGKVFGDDVLHDLRGEIQLQLLSIAALCYGDNPDIGDPMPMLEWSVNGNYDGHPEDRFREVWDECLTWNI